MRRRNLTQLSPLHPESTNHIHIKEMATNTLLHFWPTKQKVAIDLSDRRDVQDFLTILEPFVREKSHAAPNTSHIHIKKVINHFSFMGAVINAINCHRIAEQPSKNFWQVSNIFCKRNLTQAPTPRAPPHPHQKNDKTNVFL